MNSKKIDGFTLVELAIALMVIGLLIGGVLKGQELIENARITATIRQLNDYGTAVQIFKNTYNGIPGDFAKPNRIPNCNNAGGMICGTAGNGNGRIISNDTTPHEIENFNFFPHLTKAGMIQGPEGGTLDQMANINIQNINYNDENAFYFIPTLPIDTERGYYVKYYHQNYVDAISSIFMDGHYITFTSISAKILDAIDSKIDDGKPLSGKVMAADLACTIAGSNIYNHEETCDAYIDLSF